MPQKAYFELESCLKSLNFELEHFSSSIQYIFSQQWAYLRVEISYNKLLYLWSSNKKCFEIPVWIYDLLRLFEIPYWGLRICTITRYFTLGLLSLAAWTGLRMQAIVREHFGQALKNYKVT